LSTEIIKKVQERLNELIDEETNRRFRELNIVSEILLSDEGVIKVRFTPLSPYSPLAVDIGRRIKSAGLAVEGVRNVTVECMGHMLDDLVNRLVNKN
jgi:metal-sulfur cluster biosynthetic enzyme